jgi:hypothetical protein
MLLSFLSDLYEHSNINRSDLLNGCNRLLLADSKGYPKVQPGTRTGLTQCRSSISSSSRSWESFWELVAARTNVWRGCACRKKLITTSTPSWSGIGQVAHCYHHNLIGPRDGQRATWAEGDHRDGLRIGSCASVLRAAMAVYLVRIV